MTSYSYQLHPKAVDDYIEAYACMRIEKQDWGSDF
jgi:hypothetical protein